VYCGRWCQLRSSLGAFVDAALAAARRPVHAAWAIAVSAAAAALLLSAVGVLIGQLVEVANRPETAPDDTHRPSPATARVITDGDTRRLRITADRDSRVLLRDGDRALKIITIGESGTAEIPLTGDLETSSVLHVVRLDDDERRLDIPPATPAVVEAATPPETSAGRRATDSADPQPARKDAPPVLQLVRDGGPFVALTFDGDSSANRTAELLDVLQRLDLRVTLFVTGRFIEAHPGIIRRAVLSGHEIGNHTYSHPHLTTYASNRRHDLHPEITRERLQAELRRTEKAFAAATGRTMLPLWRAPYGEENRALRAWALELGYLHVRWSSLDRASLDSRDWVADEHSSLYQSSSAIMQRLARFPELRGGIVLMHLSTERADPPWDELPAFIEEIRRRNLEPAPVSRLLESSRTWRPWLQRAQERHRETFER
jgi:peptidoglycan/xylan/chitin deacetylase (PgdA/CDA1 family)